MPWLAVWGTCWRGKQSSGLDPDPEPQSPYFPAARSTSFALLVWLGMNGTGLVFFQTGFTLPHYKLHHVLSFPLPYLPVSFKGNAGSKRGAFAGSCSELRGQAKVTLYPAWCFKQLPPAGRGCIENVWEKTLKREKRHKKGGEKKYSKEARDKLQVVDYFSPRL